MKIAIGSYIKQSKTRSYPIVPMNYVSSVSCKQVKNLQAVPENNQCLNVMRLMNYMMLDAHYLLICNLKNCIKCFS